MRRCEVLLAVRRTGIIDRARGRVSGRRRRLWLSGLLGRGLRRLRWLTAARQLPKTIGAMLLATAIVALCFIMFSNVVFFGLADASPIPPTKSQNSKRREVQVRLRMIFPISGLQQDSVGSRLSTQSIIPSDHPLDNVPVITRNLKHLSALQNRMGRRLVVSRDHGSPSAIPDLSLAALVRRPVPAATS